MSPEIAEYLIESPADVPLDELLGLIRFVRTLDVHIARLSHHDWPAKSISYSIKRNRTEKYGGKTLLPYTNRNQMIWCCFVRRAYSRRATSWCSALFSHCSRKVVSWWKEKQLFHRPIRQTRVCVSVRVSVKALEMSCAMEENHVEKINNKVFHSAFASFSAIIRLFFVRRSA